MRTYAVIGKNFGDEGKGLVSASLCLHLGKNLIIKHNGGAQAGHTVECRRGVDSRCDTESRHDIDIRCDMERGCDVTDDLVRFIHHQIGSGAEFGASTLLAETYYSDLYQLGSEIENFNNVYGFIPQIYAENNTPITVIDDVLLNMAIESKRGDNRHGSCGMGINECRERIVAGFGLTVSDITENDVDWIFDRLKYIRNEHTQARMGELGLDESAGSGEFGADRSHGASQELDGYKSILEMLDDDNVLLNFSEAVKRNVDYIKVIDADRSWLESFDRIVFESGQGLLLDEFYLRYAPNLTTSRTGIINPITFLKKRGMILNEVIYVTRSYVTRHGAGQLPCECKREELPRVEYDITNEPNEWQGSIRYARHVDYEDFLEAMLQDSKYCDDLIDISLAVTHLNETGGMMCFRDFDVSMEAFEKEISKRVSGRQFYRIYKSFDRVASLDLFN